MPRRSIRPRSPMVALTLVGSLVVVSTTPVAASTAKPAPPATRCPGSGFAKGLRALAAARAKLVGTAYRSEFAAGDPCYARVAVREFDAPDPASVTANIKRLRQAGLRVRITEMDVRVPTSGGAASHADLLAQRHLYRDLVRTCLRAPNCDGVTFWGFTDAHSWITENQSTFVGQGAAHPFDKSYRPKPAYRGLHRAFGRA